MNKEEEVEVNKEEKIKPRKLAEGKRKRENDGTEDKVPRKKRRGQLQTMLTFGGAGSDLNQAWWW